jgi:hypothetical protein
MTEALDMSARRTEDTEAPLTLDTRGGPVFVPPDILKRARELKRALERSPLVNGRHQHDPGLRVQVVQLARDAAELGIHNARIAEMIGQPQSQIYNWGKMHNMPTGAKTQNSSTKRYAKPNETAPAAAKTVKATRPEKAEPGPTERWFVESVEALLRVYEMGSLDAESTLAAIQKALGKLTDGEA